MFSKATILFFLHLLGVFAHPSASRPAHSHNSRQVCVPPGQSDSSKDDTPAIHEAIAKCGNGGTISIPSYGFYHLRSALDLSGCNGCTIELDGVLQVSDDTNYWSTQGAVISVNRASQARIVGSGLIDGNGQRAWDEYAKNKNLRRPFLLQVSDWSKGVTVSGLRLRNSPSFFIAQSGNAQDCHYENLDILAESTSGNLPMNTDGIDIGDSTYTSIRNVSITNYDDCIAFKPGVNYLTVENVRCGGRCHGLSVGSLGKSSNDQVQNVYVNGAKMSNCQKAAGIKLYPGGPKHGVPSVKNVTWNNIEVDGSDYAVQIQSCYFAPASYCEKYPSKATLSDVHFNGFHGRTSGRYQENVTNLDCPKAGTCDVHFQDWKVGSHDGNGKDLCANTPGDIDIPCVAGANQ